MLVVALILVPATALLVTVPVWIERQAAARDAAANAARAAVVQAEPAVVGSMVSGTEQAWGLAPGTLAWSARGEPGGRAGTFTVEVTVELPAVNLPLLGPIGAVDWTTSHSEPVPVHRSGR